MADKARLFWRRGFLGRLLSRACGSGLALFPFFQGRRAGAQSAGGIGGFDHVAAPMRNEAAMAGFYSALGFRVDKGARIYSVHCGDNKINFHRPALWQDPQFTLRAPAAQPPCGDFCFVWTGSEQALAAVLQRAGAAVIAGPVRRRGGRGGGSVEGTSRYARDPDGNLLEFIVY